MPPPSCGCPCADRPWVLPGSDRPCHHCLSDPPAEQYSMSEVIILLSLVFVIYLLFSLLLVYLSISYSVIMMYRDWCLLLFITTMLSLSPFTIFIKLTKAQDRERKLLMLCDGKQTYKENQQEPTRPRQCRSVGRHTFLGFCSEGSSSTSSLMLAMVTTSAKG